QRAISDTKAFEALKVASTGGLTSGVWRNRSDLEASTFKHAQRTLEMGGEGVRIEDRWVAARLGSGGRGGRWFTDQIAQRPLGRTEGTPNGPPVPSFRPREPRGKKGRVGKSQSGPSISTRSHPRS